VRPESTTSALARTVRGGAMACCATVLAITAHVLGGGSTPPSWLAAALTAALASAGVALADRQRGPLMLLLAFGASQATMHWLLDVAEHWRHAAHTLHTHAPAASADPLLMIALHALAALAMALLLAVADRAASGVAEALRWLLRLLLHACSVVPLPDRHADPVLPVAGRQFVDIVLRRLCRRRGPPLYLH
jgi:hypothetical protein